MNIYEDLPETIIIKIGKKTLYLRGPNKVRPMLEEAVKRGKLGASYVNKTTPCSRS